MAYYTQQELEYFNFKHVGKNVQLSTKASIYNFEQIEIGDNSRIDDFCVISGSIKIGRNVHFAPFCLVAGGENGIVMEDFVGLAYHVQVFTQSDDYSGTTMTNPTVPVAFTNVIKKEILIKKHSIVGAGSIILPGVLLDVGTSIGAMSLVRKTTEPWSVYLGNPAKKIKNRSRYLLELEKEYLNENI